MYTRSLWFLIVACLSAAAIGGSAGSTTAAETAAPWKVGTPIVTYWCGPTLTDAVAQQMADGGWNLVWSGEKQLDVAQRHHLRAQLQDPLLAPATLDNPAERAKLDALIGACEIIRALYSYFIIDEPSAAAFPALGRLVTYLRQRDPAHLAYINLFPTYATNEQLGTKGAAIPAYNDYLGQFVKTVKPSLLSYDHYQFAVGGDQPDYFLNLKLVRRAALDAKIPFLNIVQAATWTPSMRVPDTDELRFLLYTTLASGGQGISYYIYQCPGHTGGMALADGKPTPLYQGLKSLNPEFVAIAKQLQPLRSLAVYHAGMSPPGSEPLPASATISLRPADCPVGLQAAPARSRADAGLFRRERQAESCTGRESGLQNGGIGGAGRARQFRILRCGFGRLVGCGRRKTGTPIAARRGKARSHQGVRRGRRATKALWLRPPSHSARSPMPAAAIRGTTPISAFVAYTEAGFQYLKGELTAERVAEFFRGLGATRVERFELPRVQALNFLLYNALAGGASRSLANRYARQAPRHRDLGSAAAGAENLSGDLREAPPS